MNINEIETRRKAAALEMEALDKLAEALRMKCACDCGGSCGPAGEPGTPGIPPEGVAIQTPPMPVQVISPMAELGQDQQGIIVMPAMQKLASIELLDKVAEELEKSEDPEIKKLAFEVDTITDMLEKVAHVYEYDYNDPEVEMKDAFQNKIVDSEKDEPYMKNFGVDKSYEVAKALKDGRLYAKVEDLKK